MALTLGGILGAMRDLLTGTSTGSESPSVGGVASPSGSQADRANEEAVRQADDQRRVLNQLVGKKATTQRQESQVRQDPHALVGSQVSARSATGAAGTRPSLPVQGPAANPVQERISEIDAELGRLQADYDTALASGRPDALLDGIELKMKGLATEAERLAVIPQTLGAGKVDTRTALVEEYLRLSSELDGRVGYDALENGQAQLNGETITRRDHVAALLERLGIPVEGRSPEEIRTQAALDVGSAGALDAALEPEVDPAAERFLKNYLGDTYDGPEVQAQRLTKPQNAEEATRVANQLAREVTAEVLGLNLDHLPENPSDEQLVAFRELSEKYVSKASNWLQLSEQDPEVARAQMLRELFKSPDAARPMLAELRQAVQLNGQLGRLPPDVRAALTQIAETGTLPPHVQQLLGEKLQSPLIPPELKSALTVTFESGQLDPHLAAALMQSSGKGNIPPHLERALRTALEQGTPLPPGLERTFRQAIEAGQLPPELRAGMLLSPYLAKLPPELRQNLGQAVQTGEVPPELRTALQQAAQLGRLPPDLRAQVLNVAKGGDLPPELAAALEFSGQTGELGTPLRTALTDHARAGDVPPQRVAQFNEFLDASGQAHVSQWLSDYAETAQQPSREGAVSYLMMRARQDVLDPQTARLSLGNRGQPLGGARSGNRDRLGLLLRGGIPG